MFEGDSYSTQRGGAGQGTGQGGGQGGGEGQEGGGGGGEQQSVCVCEDLDRASQVLATAFKVLTHSFHCTATL